MNILLSISRVFLQNTAIYHFFWAVSANVSVIRIIMVPVKLHRLFILSWVKVIVTIFVGDRPVNWGNWGFADAAIEALAARASVVMSLVLWRLVLVRGDVSTECSNYSWSRLLHFANFLGFSLLVPRNRGYPQGIGWILNAAGQMVRVLILLSWSQ